MSPKGKRTATPRVADAVRRDLNIPKSFDEQMRAIAANNGYTIQSVYTHAVQRYIDSGPMMELGRKVFEMQQAMALDMKQMLEAQIKFGKDLADLRNECLRRDPPDDGR